MRKIALAGTDSVLELAKGKADFQLSDDDFKLFVDYHFQTCEKRELLGSHSHLLSIYRKQLSP